MEFIGLLFLGGIAAILHFGKNESDLAEELEQELDTYLNDVI
jgi:hypothetical protein